MWPQMAASALKGRTHGHHTQHFLFAASLGISRYLACVCAFAVDNAAVGIAGVLSQAEVSKETQHRLSLAARSAIPPTGSQDVGSPTLAPISAL